MTERHARRLDPIDPVVYRTSHTCSCHIWRKAGWALPGRQGALQQVDKHILSIRICEACIIQDYLVWCAACHLLVIWLCGTGLHNNYSGATLPCITHYIAHSHLVKDPVIAVLLEEAAVTRGHVGRLTIVCHCPRPKTHCHRQCSNSNGASCSSLYAPTCPKPGWQNLMPRPTGNALHSCAGIVSHHHCRVRLTVRATGFQPQLKALELHNKTEAVQGCSSLP